MYTPLPPHIVSRRLVTKLRKNVNRDDYERFDFFERKKIY